MIFKSCGCYKMYVLCYVVAIDDIAFLEYEATINEKKIPCGSRDPPSFLHKILVHSQRLNVTLQEKTGLCVITEGCNKNTYAHVLIPLQQFY